MTAIPRRSGLLLGGAALLAVLFLFGSTMCGRQRLAFRDVGHFYAPLYQSIGQAETLLPLWDPYDHTGVPIAGEVTTALFYPPRLLFALGLPGSVAMGWYVAIHLVLAIAAVTRVARSLGCGVEASWLAGIGYGLCGPLLFLYCNPPFLVGAAWLPLALAAALRLSEGWSWPSFQGTAFSLAMCTLGGDPQTTFHIGLVVGGTLAWRQVASMQAARRPLSDDRPRPPRPRWIPVLAAAGFAGVLAAPQIAAALDWSRHSARRYEPAAGVSRWLVGEEANRERAWWQTPPPGSHAADVYGFSVAPWHWLDMVIPQLSGSLFPEYQRLSALLPADSRVWTITLYAGVVPLLALASRYLRRRRPDASCLGIFVSGKTLASGPTGCLTAAQGPQLALSAQKVDGIGRRPAERSTCDVWDALIPLGILFSLGSFGPLWLLKTGLQAGGVTTLDAWHDALFSPYWALVSTVPGYGVFRYPAKWLPFVMLGASVTTARCFSQLNAATLARMRRAAHAVGGAALLGALLSGVIWLFPTVLDRWTAGVRPDPFWGPLAARSAVASVFCSSLHVLIVVAAVRWLLRQSLRWCPSRRVAAIAGVVLIDLLIASHGQIAAIDRHREEAVLARLEADAAWPAQTGRVIRTRIGEGWPQEWRRSSSSSRLLEVEASGRHALFGRWHLEREVGVLNSATSIVPQRTRTFWRAAKRVAGRLPADERAGYWTRLARVFGIDGFLSRSEQAIPLRDPAGDRLMLADRSVQPIDGPWPRVRWHDRWQCVAPQQSVSEADWQRAFGRWDEGGGYRPIVESGPAADAEQQTAEPASDAGSQARIDLLEQGPNSSVRGLEVTAPRPGLLLVSRYQDGHWRAEIRGGEQPWQEVPVYAVDYLSQGIFLPAGSWEVRFRYRPPWLVPTVTMAALGFLLVAFLGPAMLCLRSLATNGHEPPALASGPRNSASPASPPAASGVGSGFSDRA